MSHKDAPPETESQKACREWWEKAQPTVKRAWGRAADGSFLAEETRLIHQAWEAASQQANAEVEKLRAEIDALRTRLEDTVRDSTNEIEALRTEAEQHLQQAMSNGAKARAAQAQANNLRTEIEALRAEAERSERCAEQSERERLWAEERAERLAEEVERLRADRDSWEQQASDRVADWHAEHLRAERLAEALETCLEMEERPKVIELAKAALAAQQKEPKP